MEREPTATIHHTDKLGVAFIEYLLQVPANRISYKQNG